MSKPRTVRMASDRTENPKDIASSYIKGERIKKMLKAASYEGPKGEVLVKLDKITISLDLVCYQVDLLSRINTNKVYEIVCSDGISKLNFNKLNK